MRRRIGWLAAVLGTVTLVVLALLVTVGRANRQHADDPRSTTAAGAGALGALLAAEGVRITTTDEVEDAIAAAAPGRGLVVVNGGRLHGDEASLLLNAGYDRVLLLHPDQQDMEEFDVAATLMAARSDSRPADCGVDAAERAGSITVTDSPSGYAATGPAGFACFPFGNGGYAYLRAGTDLGPAVELVSGGVSNADLAEDGNAAFGMNVFGGQAELTWLMTRRTPAATASRPTLLPPWWPIAVAQLGVAFLVVSVWRGRRLGPIMTEPLPVAVRAAETVEGHGRLYHRLDAYDRAAAALRAGTLDRLGRAYGSATDPLALSAAVADRLGLDPVVVRRMLVDAHPATDTDLVNLASDLNRLEQEARRL